VASGVRLADLLAALSLATDLGFGQPIEHMLRSSRIAMRLGDRLALDDQQMVDLYDVSLLTYVGCSVHGDDAARVFGDDIDFRANVAEIDLAGFAARRYMMGRAGHGTSTGNRVRQLAGMMVDGGRGVMAQMAEHCAAAGELADRLALGPEVRAGVEQAYARWDGRGLPPDLAGDGVSLYARIAHVAEACEVLIRTLGANRALELVGARRGTQFDPTVVDAVTGDPDPLFAGIEDDALEAVVDSDPSGRPALTEDELDRALEAIGDFCDLRCRFFAGHARGTAELAVGAAAAAGLPPRDRRLLRRAALVHDVGRFGVPGSVWAKPGPLSASELERVRLHVYFVERMFSRPEPLRRVGLLAATHHERMDGSGYHRAMGGAALAMPARILAAADAYHAMLQHRPHRPARSGDEATAELKADADAGRLDGVAVDAVLDAAGRPRGRERAGGPGGLTSREADVVALLARGLSNKQIATELGISGKTVSSHLEHAYTKLGVSSRSAATMKALQHGLVSLDAHGPD
jgi:HD-GYP domain-containing protein (c-di-GMP phosphodiesterase class II)